LDKALDLTILAPASTLTWVSIPTKIIPTRIKAGMQIKINGVINILTMAVHGEIKIPTMGPGEINIQIKGGTIINPTLIGDKIKDGVTKIPTKDGEEIKIKDLITTAPQAGETQVIQAAHGGHQTHTTGTTHTD
jgi:hypothetical protein